MGLFTAIGTWLGASAGAAFATGATVAAATTVAGASIYGAAQAGKGQEMPKMPDPVDTSAASQAARDMVRRRRAMSTDTIYTSPLGQAEEANVARKTLLGQ